MLINVINALQYALEPLFLEVRPYEGEFDALENLENTVINPPSCLIELSEAQMRLNAFRKDIQATLFIITSHLSGNDNNGIYAKIEEVINLLHAKTLKTSNGLFAGNVEFISFVRGLVCPGLCVYTMNFTIKE